MINGYYALALDIITQDEIDKIATYAFKINEILIDYFGSKGIDLIDFKIEFGRYHGQIILIDEISPDTCRLWDKQTHVKLDKDRFKRDLGNVQDAYQEVFKRLGIMQLCRRTQIVLLFVVKFEGRVNGLWEIYTKNVAFLVCTI